MKTFIMVIALFIIAIGASAQSMPYLSAGASYNIIESQAATILNSTGYYAGAGLATTAGRWMVNAELQFMNQRVKNDAISARANSLNIFLYGGLRPTKLPLYLIAGTQMGFVTGSEMTGNDTTFNQKGPRYSVIGGLSYKIKRYEVITKYYRTVDGPDLFDHTFQLGVNYILN